MAYYAHVEEVRKGPRIMYRFVCPSCTCKGDPKADSTGAAGDLEDHIGGPHCRPSRR